MRGLGSSFRILEVYRSSKPLSPSLMRKAGIAILRKPSSAGRSGPGISSSVPEFCCAMLSFTPTLTREAHLDQIEIFFVSPKITQLFCGFIYKSSGGCVGEQAISGCIGYLWSSRERRTLVYGKICRQRCGATFYVRVFCMLVLWACAQLYEVRWYEYRVCLSADGHFVRVRMRMIQGALCVPPIGGSVSVSKFLVYQTHTHS